LPPGSPDGTVPSLLLFTIFFYNNHQMYYYNFFLDGIYYYNLALAAISRPNSNKPSDPFKQKNTTKPSDSEMLPMGPPIVWNLTVLFNSVVFTMMPRMMTWRLPNHVTGSLIKFYSYLSSVLFCRFNIVGQVHNSLQLLSNCTGSEVTKKRSKNLLLFFFSSAKFSGLFTCIYSYFVHWDWQLALCLPFFFPKENL